ncbi:hypothetical protein [Pseudomonas sp. MM227]|uniref:hypothetical protein n=1 Tax=Pseudomonas sp. MM227 TaxID=3019968 RepID=UPI00221EDB0A|nr:hypothetical protein [Pseudomonas sp. MM227]
MNALWRPGRRTGVLLSLALSAVVLSACQTTRERLLAEGYPAPFASGFEDGCGSGRHAAQALGEFRKNVPVYLSDRQYATGWDDGFRQCQASAVADFQRHVGIDSKEDRDWRHARDQGWGKALGR